MFVENGQAARLPCHYSRVHHRLHSLSPGIHRNSRSGPFRPEIADLMDSNHLLNAFIPETSMFPEFVVVSEFCADQVADNSVQFAEDGSPEPL